MSHQAYTSVRIDKGWLGSRCKNESCQFKFTDEDEYVVEDSYGYPCCDDSCALMSDVYQNTRGEV